MGAVFIFFFGFGILFVIVCTIKTCAQKLRRFRTTTPRAPVTRTTRSTAVVRMVNQQPRQQQRHPPRAQHNNRRLQQVEHPPQPNHQQQQQGGYPPEAGHPPQPNRHQQRQQVGQRFRRIRLEPSNQQQEPRAHTPA